MSLLAKSRLLIPDFPNWFSLPKPIYSLDAFAQVNERHKQAICLTFDDGPDPVYTPKILSLLADYNAKATFFVMGSVAEQHPELVAQIVKNGHAIGNHTYAHHHPWMINSALAKSEVTKTSSILERITGTVPRWFRPPFGRLRGVMRKRAYLEKMETVLWNHSIIDWGPLGTRAGITQRLDKIKAGDIVLMHDGKREQNHPEIILQCLPVFLRSLHDKSLVTATLDEFSQIK